MEELTEEERFVIIELALRINNIQLHKDLLSKVIKIIDKVNESGKKVTLKDVCKI